NYNFSILNNDIKDETRAFRVLQDYAEASNAPTAYRMLADKLNEKGDKVKAGEYYERALSIKQDANTYSAVANFYRSNNQWAKSNEVLIKLVETNPDQATLLTAYRLMGDNYNKLNNKAKMAEYFEKALNIESDDKIALLLASYYNGLKNHNKVITYSTMVLRSNSGNNDALMLRGLAYYNLKRNAEAKADLTRIQNDPKYGKQVQSILKAIK
ncbi:MAG TPA: tetratricopeptide repeat protein, partial [Candidatus Cloacimonadota bacterium]|nr:tetratricopeptide repeat protein [Candidatus Cloacimonadota bacterium]